MLLLQYLEPNGARRVGVLDAATKIVRAIEGYATTYDMANAAIVSGRSLESLAADALGEAQIEYKVLAAEKRVLSPLDHPDPAHCYVTGTGLTHLGSADARDAMHKKIDAPVESLSDSMKMFRMGVEGGKPRQGETGVQPEWFYKGDGSIVCASEQALPMPEFAPSRQRSPSETTTCPPPDSVPMIEAPPPTSVPSPTTTPAEIRPSTIDVPRVPAL